MSDPEFALVPIGELHEHEEVDAGSLRELIERIRTDGLVRDPIWVARGSGVILNGHHRYHALRALGAVRVPAWLFDYDDSLIALERWGPGPPVTKALVVERARTGVPFPPKTTRHLLRVALPEHPTPLAELLPTRGSAQPAAPARASSSGRPGGGR